MCTQKVKMNLSTLYRKLSSRVKSTSNQLAYAQASIRNRFPCKIISIEKQHSTTTITYCILGKKNNVHTISIESLLDDPLLIEKFSPKDNVIIGYIVCGDLILHLTNEEQHTHYNETLKQLMEY